MDEYIKRKDALQATTYMELVPSSDYNIIKLTLLAAQSVIRKIPSADVVEVVRCKDCVKRHTGECAMSYECSCGGQWSWEIDNGFCVFGERKSQDDRTP